MGYRHYFFEVDKKDVDKVKDKTYEELLEMAREYDAEIEEEYGEQWFYFNDDKFMNKKCIFEFGKLYWDDTAERICNKGQRLFLNDDTHACLGDYDAYVVGREGMLEAITIYKEKVINYYKDLLKEDTPEVLSQRFSRHVDNMLMWWERLGAINTDFDKEYISNSWLYEHQIFELVRLYKTIDWDNNCLLFYGW